MAFVRLDDLSGSVEAIVFNSAFAAARDLLEADRVVLVKGRVDHKDGETKLVALEVTAFAVGARAPRGAPARRRAPRARGRRPRARRRRARLSGRGARRAQPRDRPSGPKVLAFGAGVQGEPGLRLLRRGQGAPRGGRGRIERAGDPTRHQRDGRAPTWVSPPGAHVINAGGGNRRADGDRPRLAGERTPGAAGRN